MDTDIRIPVTYDQKEKLRAAADAKQLDLTAWARPILLREAEKAAAGKKPKGSKNDRKRSVQSGS
jgi:hypothetical protein